MPAKGIWNATELKRGLQVLFFQAYDSRLAAAVYPQIAMVVDSSSGEEIYPWLGGLPKVREFLDERQVNSLSSFDFTIKNKEWESTIGVKRSELEDDRTGQLKIRINSMADSAVLHQDELTVGLLKAGLGTDAASLCFDGQSFFDTDHPYTKTNKDGSMVAGTFSNKGTAALTEANLQAAIKAMMKYTDNKGNLLGVIPTHLVVGPDLMFTAQEILKREVDSDGKPNLLKGMLTLVVSPYITETSAGKYPWFVLDCSRAIKPLILQVRTPVEFNSLEAESETGFMRREYLYGTYARYNAGYGLWQLAYGSDGSA